MAYEATFKISNTLIVSIKFNGLLNIPIYSAYIQGKFLFARYDVTLENERNEFSNGKRFRASFFLFFVIS